MNSELVNKHYHNCFRLYETRNYGSNPNRVGKHKNCPKTNYFLKSETKIIYSSLLHFESASDFNMKLLSYPLRFPTPIRTRQYHSRSPSYDL